LRLGQPDAFESRGHAILGDQLTHGLHNYRRAAAITPLGRVGEPEDLAKAVRFFAGPDSAWITGQNIACDGGQELSSATPY
jgi:NAD(P)-dependent dehydrogenase (short-subunit alcohol dehydrogenase family)